MKSSRDMTVGALRGLAIVTMIAANSAAEVLAHPHPWWIRAYGSFAAPTFILLSGMMVGLAARADKHSLNYFLGRGALLLAVGAILDVSGGDVPFLTIDVLYLIGLSVPIAFFFRKLSAGWRLASVLAIFLIAAPLRHVFGYRAEMTNLELSEWTFHPPIAGDVLRYWFLDGWFPILPWLGFSLLGVHLALYRWESAQTRSFATRRFAFLGSGLLAAGIPIFLLFPGPLAVREGYSELFYPATIGYLLIAVGLIISALAILDIKARPAVYRTLCLLGDSSLFFYILHLAVIEFFLSVIWPDSPLPRFALIYAGFLATMFLTVYGLRALKNRWTSMPFLARFFLGS